MRKRILCTALLSLLALWAMAVPAMAASAYHALQSLAASQESYTFDNYAAEYTLPSTITFTAAFDYQSKSTTGYVTATKVTWEVAVSPEGMAGSTAPGITAGNDLSASNHSTTGTLKGTVKGACTLTITAKHGNLSETVDIAITVPEKPDPTISAGDTATQFIGEASSTLALKTSSGTATTGDTVNNNKITFINCPEYIEITPDEDTLAEYGVTVTASGTNGTALDATTTRDVTFASTADDVTKLTDGVTITLTAYNIKEDGTKSTAVTKNITLIIKEISPSAWTTEAGGASTDLGSKAAEHSEETTNNLSLVKANVDIGSAIKWTLQNVTTPVTFTAQGLPPGLSLTVDDEADEPKTKQTKEFGAAITGTPTTPGYYDKIYITATNTGGSIKGGPYILDIVNAAEITVDEIPDMIWGKDYTYTIPALGGENKKHPLTFGIKEGENSPGLKITSATKGTLAGRYESSDKEAEEAGVDDFVFGDESEKEITLTLTVKNDYLASSKDVNFKIKGVKPVLVNSAAAAQNELNKATITIKDGVTWKDGTPRYPISVTGPGTMTFSFDNLPAGIEATKAETDPDHPSRMIVTFQGMPEVTAKNHSATLTVYNAVGAQKIPLKFNITADEEDFTVSPDKGAIKPVIINGTKTKSIDKFALEASFGPVLWRAKNLPSGLKLSIDKSVSHDKRVVITGTPKAATKLDKNGQSIYEITATNPPTGYTFTVSQDFKLFAKPVIQTKNLPTINLEKPYSAKIVGSGGTSADLTWLVTITEVPAGSSDKTSLPATKGVVDTGSSTKNFKPEAAPAGKSTITVSSDAKTGMPVIVGSLDRMPAGGRLKVHAQVTVAEGTDVEQSTSVDIIVQVKGTAAKLTTPSTWKFEKGDTNASIDVVATGTLPIYMKALIAEDDVKKLLNFDTATAAASAFCVDTYSEPSGKTTKNYIDLTNKGSNNLGVYLEYDPNALDGKGKLRSTSAGKYNIANLPIKIQAGNAVTYNNKTFKVELKSSDRTIKVTAAGSAPAWKMGSADASPDITIFETDGTAIANVTYTVSADLPYTITVSPTTTSDKTRNGLYAEITQPTSSAAGKVVIKGTPTKDKETKTLFTLTVTNPSSKQKSQAKVTVIGQKRPEISTKITDGYLAEKVVEVGKPLSYKISAKGSKIAYSKASRDIVASSDNKIFATNMVAYAPIVWEISGDTATLKAISLDFDTATGMFKGTPKLPTSKDGTYEPLEFTVKPVNTAAGTALSTATAKVKIGVKGKKPRIPSQSVTLVRGNESYDIEDNQLQTNIASDDTSAYITWAWDSNADYSTWGLDKTITRVGNFGKLAGANLPTATKGVNLRVVAENVGSEAAGNVKFIIRDQAPEIKASSETLTIAAEKDAIVTQDVDFELTDKGKMMTGDTKFEWKISAKPSNTSVKAAIKVYSDGDGCTVTLTVPKRVSPDIKEATFTVTAKNRSTNETASKTVTFNVTKYTEALPAEKDALPEDKVGEELAEKTAEEEEFAEEEELAAGEGTVTYGRERTESGLTQAERSMLAEGGYVIAAILPEITTDASGQYDLDVVSLDEAAAEGAELVWFAFPRNAESTEDDSIAEFYDEAGAEIYAVPESKKVVVSPWLEAEVTYAPVIAVKAPVAGDAKTSLDEAEEGDTVTEQAIENAAETPEEK